MSGSNAQRMTFPVPIDDQPAPQFAGFFHPAVNAPARRVLQVLAHGVSYDHRYWDGPTINDVDYSYVRYMTAHGFDILALDLPGVGSSDKPESGDFSVRAVGRALSTLIAALRRPNTIPGYEFDHVVSVGHSLGSTVGIFAEANWPAADLLVVTATGNYPLRPRGSWAPGERESLLGEPYALVPTKSRVNFYHRSMADPDVIAYDDATLRTRIPSRLWSNCIDLSNDPTAAGVAEVTCPMYIQLGQYDPILPGRYAEQERALYTGSVDVVVEALPEMGHCFNLHLNHEHGWRGIRDRLAALSPGS